jgi:DNA-binding MarR family transcriptional regulator
MTKESLTSSSKEISSIIPYIIRGMLKRQADALGKGKITIHQYITLELLTNNESVKMKDIAKELNITFPAATGLVNRLHRMGMVKRAPGENDRRVIYITSTGKGREIVKQVRSHRQKAIQEVFGGLTEKERTDYLRIIKKVKNILYPEK